MRSVLKRYHGYGAFRSYQKEVIDQVLAGKDCPVVMATGINRCGMPLPAKNRITAMKRL